ncbi:putative ABC-type branched-chain amino acid transport system, periplasmic component [Thiomonas arsenitoxydans]|uniref:ABC-type branched-chain amino acid transport system, periplasmic component n=1 Tax=Thiomonas arsenitoxydans (strain DSM 22701 / CIP 110005 / 3As) TaxID=426114 RepID=D6CQQ6_THIA3|nr:ABC transporter substrate-binding protein [Thiomonas arsenitoxydans]CAZ86947.1 putative ABC-type branched-chain amino acid transport system, periplasmic component [Thiomonas arsenitoxydans]CQR27872.1 putative ABC-type branched-chain amino acid transport system, periplasmic component [Thiomonas arsenitoxydans]CQR30272.1 putative ABC-type branched-chain amino acid transport system, periplasmic component [Thiomonas arsenitoxydans]CQR32118.1 putative ABC-type branched-chain amino acid transport 
MNKEDWNEQVQMDRRTLIKAGGAAGLAALLGTQVPSWGASETPVKIGLIDPITSTFAALGQSEIKGAKFAEAEINKAGGVMGRPLQIFVEDSAGNPGTAVDKASRLLSQNKVDFLMGTVNSAASLAVSQFANRHDKLFVCTGGHVDSLTGKECKTTTFRTCSTTWMLTAGDFETLYKKFGKKWYFLTTDYAFGQSEQADYTTQLKKAGGSVVGGALVPVGATDFSSYLIDVKAKSPDVLCLLLAGNDQVNCMKQIAQFGINKDIAVGGALFELEQAQALPEAARYGWWTMEWYWNQPNTPHVADFVKRYAAANKGEYPTARAWFGFATTHAIRLAVEKAKSLETAKVVKAMEGLVLPPEIALQPGNVFYRPQDHQLMLGMFPGHVIQTGKYPNLFDVSGIVPGEKIALPPSETGCVLPRA